MLNVQSPGVIYWPGHPRHSAGHSMMAGNMSCVLYQNWYGVKVYICFSFRPSKIYQAKVQFNSLELDTKVIRLECNNCLLHRANINCICQDFIQNTPNLKFWTYLECETETCNIATVTVTRISLQHF